MERIFVVSEVDGAWEIWGPGLAAPERHESVEAARASALRLAGLQRPARVILCRPGEPDFVVFLRNFAMHEEGPAATG